jgi:NTP pyrophosphatase (non-canonical NTP hydrolase)
LVRHVIGQLGGYWRPLAGLARLLEELGELAESLADPSGGAADLASEMADLWIISTAIFDQFLGEAEEPGAVQGQEVISNPSVSELLVAAGQIARIINYYDGPKTPRSVAGWPSLEQAVTDLHHRLAALARACGVELDVAVGKKLESIPPRDSGRFEQAEHDPSTAPFLERFHCLSQAVEMVEGRTWGRAWGAPPWSARSLEENVDAILPSLSSFTKAAPRERLEAYVIAAPSLGSSQERSQWLERLLGELGGLDPGAPDSLGGADGALSATISFNGVEMSVAVVPSLDASIRPHGALSETFVVFRPIV